MKRTCSGKLLLRLEPALHLSLASGASRKGLSVNTYCTQLIRQGMKRSAAEVWWSSEAKKCVARLKRRFGEKLVAVALFGSQIQGTSTDASDLDFLIVLDGSIPVTRSLYAWWDEKISWEGRAEASPQFVHLPEGGERAGSIWFEIAMASEILWEQGRAFSFLIAELKTFIAEDRIRRHWAGGQPYWVRRDDEEQRSRA